MRRALASVILGLAVTALGLFVAYASDGSAVGRIFYWQGYCMEDLVPAPNLGTPEHPLYEGTPIHIFAFFMGIPVGILLYSLLAFAVLTFIDIKNMKSGHHR